MITTPATLASVCLYIPSAEPIPVAASPSAMKMVLKPRMNPMEFTITRRIRFASGAFSSSTPTPEIMETYPGTSGSTQGERKETKPAKNAPIIEGVGRVDIESYCNCWLLPQQNQTYES